MKKVIISSKNPIKIQTVKMELLRNIERLIAPKGYLWAGLPNFKRLFGRDSLISAWQLLRLKTEIAESTLRILAEYQGKEVNSKQEEEPGKILHEHYDQGFFQKIVNFFQGWEKLVIIRRYLTWHFPYYGSVDSTAWWLILLGEYFKETGNRKVPKELWPNVQKALSWIEKYGDVDGDGFIEYERKNPHGLFHQSWKDGLKMKIQPPIAMVEVQGYYYLAYRVIGKMAQELMNNSGLKKELGKKAQALKEKFNREFWMPKENYFALALDGKKKKVRAITSNPGHCLFTGIIKKDKVEKVVKRLFEEDLWTPYGIRTHSSKEPDFNPTSYHQGSIWPHDNWIIYKGLEKYGYMEEAEMIKKALISAYKALSHIPELYGVKDGKIFPIKGSCYLQAWAEGALLNLLS